MKKIVLLGLVWVVLGEFFDVSAFFTSKNQNSGENSAFLDQDGDGLLDFEEISGCEAIFDTSGQILCSKWRFPATNPQKTDTDGDGLWDLGEIRGCDVYLSKNGYECGQKVLLVTDPTQKDTDHDGKTDFEENFDCEATIDARGWVVCAEKE